jgi:hypothetical protein
MSGHRPDLFGKLSKGNVDIVTGVSDLKNFEEMCVGVEIVTHLKPYSTHPRIVTLIE